jgi:hypothetical protein
LTTSVLESIHASQTTDLTARHDDTECIPSSTHCVCSKSAFASVHRPPPLRASARLRPSYGETFEKNYRLQDIQLSKIRQVRNPKARRLPKFNLVLESGCGLSASCRRPLTAPGPRPQGPQRPVASRRSRVVRLRSLRELRRDSPAWPKPAWGRRLAIRSSLMTPTGPP